MVKERIPEEVYEDLSIEGLYEEANLDRDEVTKIKNMAIEDYEFGKRLRGIEEPNYRVL
jgi:hypothetical protein